LQVAFRAHPLATFVISRWAGHRKVLCPVVFLGRAGEAEQVAEGCLDGAAVTGEGVG